MAKNIRPITEKQFADIQSAEGHIALARELLRYAGCPKATAAVRACLKSVGGAKRHAERRLMRSE